VFFAHLARTGRRFASVFFTHPWPACHIPLSLARRALFVRFLDQQGNGEKNDENDKDGGEEPVYGDGAQDVHHRARCPASPLTAGS
jgi:hypothetical protein